MDRVLYLVDRTGHIETMLSSQYERLTAEEADRWQPYLALVLAQLRSRLIKARN